MLRVLCLNPRQLRLLVDSGQRGGNQQYLCRASRCEDRISVWLNRAQQPGRVIVSLRCADRRDRADIPAVAHLFRARARAGAGRSLLHHCAQCQREVPGRRIPIISALCQGLEHDGVDAVRQVEVQRRRPDRVALGDGLHDGVVAVAFERFGARQQLVQHDAGGKQVGAGIDLEAPNLLGRQVLQRADGGSVGAH